MQLQLLKKQNLTPNANKNVWALTFQFSENLSYAPGDWLTIKVENFPDLVNAVQQKLGIESHEVVELRRIGKVTVAQALTQHLELSQLNPAILNKLQRQYSDKLAGKYWEDRQSMIQEAYGKDILDLLTQFPRLTELKLEFLNLLSPLAPRYYSIASSQQESKNQVRILVRQVEYYQHNRIHYGVASNQLAQLNPGEKLEGEFLTNPNFKLPDDPKADILMLAAGVGLAPFIGFMAEREAQQQAGKQVGQNWLFFGETHANTTFLCKKKLQKWQVSGLLTLSTAFSRDQQEKYYIQHRLMAQAEQVYAWISRGAQIYVCGSKSRLAPAIETTLLQVLQQQTQLSLKEAEIKLQEMKQHKQLQMDVY